MSPDSTAKKVSEALFKEGLVDVCYGGRDGIALKPDPEGVFEILKEFGVEKNECLYIGDTATDIKTAKTMAHITFWVVLFTWAPMSPVRGLAG